MDSVLFSAAIYLGAAMLAVPISVRLGLGSVLGYLLGGILIGPATGLVGSEAGTLLHYAEFGVVMMLFLIGLELEPRTLWDMRARLLGLGFGQVLLTGAALAAAGWAIGLPLGQAVAVGMILSLSSTAIVMKTLDEKGLTATRGGRSAFSVLLAQDVAVIPLLALLPLLALGAAVPAAEEAHGAIGDGEGAAFVAAFRHWVEHLPGWGTALVTIGAVAAVILGGAFLTRHVFRYALMARMREMQTIAALLFVIAVADMMALVGLSPALGAFLAGVVLASSEFRHELEADIEPFKGLLLGLFFVAVGASMDFGVMRDSPLLVVGVVAGLMAIKALVLFALALAFRLRGADRTLFTLSLAQAGEFGFVLTAAAVSAAVIGTALAQILLLAIALSMLLTPLLFIAHDALAQLRGPAEEEAPASADEIRDHAEVIVAGTGRFGQVVQRMLSASGVPAVVLDRDWRTIQLLRRFGVRTYLGDPTRPELLRASGLDRARVLVVALDDRAAAIRLVRMARRMRGDDIRIIARAYDRVHFYELYAAGADKIVREMFDGSLRTARYALESLDFTESEAYEAETAFYRYDRRALLELAKLWKPGVPVEENPEYIARARAQNRELEDALIGLFGEDSESVRAEKEPLRGGDDVPKGAVRAAIRGAEDGRGKDSAA
jgi:CPA2 family monovalent cation:H+ antiporter-2